MPFILTSAPDGTVEVVAQEDFSPESSGAAAAPLTMALPDAMHDTAKCYLPSADGEYSPAPPQGSSVRAVYYGKRKPIHIDPTIFDDGATGFSEVDKVSQGRRGSYSDSFGPCIPVILHVNTGTPEEPILSAVLYHMPGNGIRQLELVLKEFKDKIVSVSLLLKNETFGARPTIAHKHRGKAEFFIARLTTAFSMLDYVHLPRIDLVHTGPYQSVYCDAEKILVLSAANCFDKAEIARFNSATPGTRLVVESDEEYEDSLAHHVEVRVNEAERAQREQEAHARQIEQQREQRSNQHLQEFMVHYASLIATEKTCLDTLREFFCCKEDLPFFNAEHNRADWDKIVQRAFDESVPQVKNKTLQVLRDDLAWLNDNLEPTRRCPQALRERIADRQEQLQVVIVPEPSAGPDLLATGRPSRDPLPVSRRPRLPTSGQPQARKGNKKRAGRMPRRPGTN